jgi:hypothetical protein
MVRLWMILSTGVPKFGYSRERCASPRGRNSSCRWREPPVQPYIRASPEGDTWLPQIIGEFRDAGSDVSASGLACWEP